MSIKYLQDENGNYYTDENGNLLTVDVNGEGSGQMLYRHDIVIGEGSDLYYIGITIINASSENIDTFEKVKNAVGIGKTIIATGSYGGPSYTSISIRFEEEHFVVSYDKAMESVIDYANADVFITDSISEIGVAGGSGGGSGTPLVETTYDELKALRDGGQLVAGQKYRITDYNCTTTQENTSSAMHQFDIIVEALSNNTLSENASAIQHGGSSGSGGGSPQFNPEVLADGEGTLVEGAVVPSYYVFEDAYEMNGTKEDYKSQDTFIAYTYMENNDGVVVPVIYKTDADGVINAPEEYDYPDREDTFFYEGTMEVDGVVYDKWRKITLTDDSEITWDSDGKVWALTNVVVTGGGSVSDPYFANCKLSAWEIKYSLDNDKTRFWWADETNGKGVIYYMKDEYNNECPYDFKNIQFDREGTYYYTFSWVDENNAVKDLSIVGNTELYNDEEQISGCFGNKMGIVSLYDFGVYDDNPTNLATALNDNVFISTYSYEDGLFFGCYSNTFGDSCYSNTFGGSCSNNTFGYKCHSNTFGDICIANTFGNECYSNTIGNFDSFNSFGDYCFANTFGNDCTYNTFGKFCASNTFGDLCHYNILDNGIMLAQPQPTTGDIMQGVHIHSGVSGQFTVTRGVRYTQDVRTANDVTITV